MKKHNVYTNLFFGLNIKTLNADIPLHKVAISYLISDSCDNSFHCCRKNLFSLRSSFCALSCVKKSIHVHSSSLLQLWESILYLHSEGGLVKPVDIISTSFQTHQYTNSATATRFHWPSPPDNRHCHRLMLVHCTLKPLTPLHVTTHYFLCLTCS